MIVSRVTARGSGPGGLDEVEAGTRKEAVSTVAEICFWRDRLAEAEQDEAKGVVLVADEELGPPALTLPALVFLIRRIGVKGSVGVGSWGSSVEGVSVDGVVPEADSILAAARAACRFAWAVE